MFSSRSRAMRFPTTRWSLVSAAGDGSPRVRKEALGALLANYLPPLRHYLVRRMRVPADRADDLLQSFVSEKVLREELVPRAERSRGRFRSFLLGALNQFVAGHARHAGRKKRRLFREVPLDTLPEPADGAADPGEAFDVAWARGVLDLALARTRAECDASGRADLWAVFEARVLGPTLGGRAPAPYEELAASLSLAAAADVYPLLVTAKRMYARNLRAVVAEYAGGPSAVEGEIAELRAALSKAGNGNALPRAGPAAAPGGEGGTRAGADET